MEKDVIGMKGFLKMFGSYCILYFLIFFCKCSRYVLRLEMRV